MKRDNRTCAVNGCNSKGTYLATNDVRSIVLCQSHAQEMQEAVENGLPYTVIVGPLNCIVITRENDPNQCRCTVKQLKGMVEIIEEHQ